MNWTKKNAKTLKLFSLGNKLTLVAILLPDLISWYVSNIMLPIGQNQKEQEVKAGYDFLVSKMPHARRALKART